MSATERAMMPIVSSVSVFECIPAGANMLKLGLNPTTPQ